MPRKSTSQTRTSKNAGNGGTSSSSGANAVPAAPLVACTSPDARTTPEFVVYLRRPLALMSVAQYGGADASGTAGYGAPTVTGVLAVGAAIKAGGPTTKMTKQLVVSNIGVPALGCTNILDMQVELGLDARYLQTWKLTEFSIGDLESTVGLAPLEQVTLEFQRTQRKVMDRSVADSVEGIDSSESTTSDKEAVNVTRSSVKTEGWHIDATGSVSYGNASLQVQAGYSNSLTQTNQQSINRATEATKKSAHNLKTLHKIEVRGVSEGLVSNRMTRVLRNPYFDRTLSINVFQLLKHFNVVTALDELRTAILLTINEMQFDNDFVVSNGDFLREALLDSALVDSLPSAIQGASPTLPSDYLQRAGDVARRALQLLFSTPNMFNVAPKGASGTSTDANSPASSFDAQITGNFWDSGLGDAEEQHLGLVHTVLGFFYKMVTTDESGASRDVLTLSNDDAISMATALAADLDSKLKLNFTDPTKDPAANDIKNILDDQQYTEIFRRMSGFLATVDGILSLLMDPANLEKQQEQARAQARLVLEQLLKHLGCNKNYYVQEYLVYIAKQTRNKAIVDLASQVLGDPLFQAKLQGASASDFDPTTAFVSQQQIIIPADAALTGRELSGLGRELFKDGSPVADPQPGIIDIEVPCDGIHLEVAEGACMLQNVPAPPTNSVSLSVQGASLGINK